MNPITYRVVMVLSLFKLEIRWSYLPPLMIYVAAGIQGLTSIVGTFFVKDYLGLSAEFLATLGFWAFVPWSMKIPVGHLVDLIWRFKSWLVVLGAGLITSSLLIMAGLIGYRDQMAEITSINAWFVWASLLSPVGYVLQDAVADAMTVEAVPRKDQAGNIFSTEKLKSMHTTMQTLGRVAIIGGTVIVALLNLWVFRGTENLNLEAKQTLYTNVYLMALIIPAISLLGIAFARWLEYKLVKVHMSKGITKAAAYSQVRLKKDTTSPNYWILGGSLVFVYVTISLGLSNYKFSQEAIFLSSGVIILWMMRQLTLSLDTNSRNTLIGTAVIIFMYRATPTVGQGMSWWMIDELKFDGPFFSILSLIGSSLALVGMFGFRRFMAERSILYVITFLSLTSFLLALPTLGMSLGLHKWTSSISSGVIDARFIALVDTALESPLGQIAMIPMLAWIANAAPSNLKATYFAVMASFTNLALSAGSLGTKYINQIFTLSREIKDPTTKIVETSANYSDFPTMLASVMLISLLMPLGAILIIRLLGWRSA